MSREITSKTTSGSTIQSSDELLLSVVVETANTPPGNYKELDATVVALDHQTLPGDRFEILLVADPELHPRLRDHLSSLSPRVRMIAAEGLHYYAQKNRGAKEARAAIVAFMDSDCIPAEGWAASILEVFAREDGSMGAVQGTVWSDRTALGFAFVITNFGLFLARRERRASSLTGNNCAFRRQDFLADPFEEDAVFHGPEVRLAARIIGNGRYILLVPGAANHHHFLPGFKLFLAHGIYWGYCFLRLRRDGSTSVPYAKFFQRLGPLAPLALVPAKAVFDLWRMIQRRADLDMSLMETAGCAVALLANSFAVGWGAFRSFLKLPPPTSPTSSNAHLAELPGSRRSLGSA